jgi:hypothetical protein
MRPKLFKIDRGPKAVKSSEQGILAQGEDSVQLTSLY